MPEFLVVAVLLVLLALVFVLFPLMMNRNSATVNRRSINITLFKSRLAELQAQQHSGDLDADEFQRLKTELERRLLDETAEQEQGRSAAAPGKASKTVILGLAVLIPLIACTMYYQTGAKADWEITETLKQTKQKAAANQNTDAEMDSLLQQLTARLKQRPDNGHYLMLLGNSQMQLQNYPAATDAFQRLSLLVPNDPVVWAYYAQALYLASNRNLTDQVMTVANRALSADPQQSTVLGLLGIASFEKGDYQGAVNYWQRLLPALPAASPNRQMIEAGIKQAKTLLAASGVDVAVDADPAASSEEESGSASSLQVAVKLDASISADANASVFVFARALSGPRMPLAVARLKVSDLPASVTLDDSMAMAPGLNLSSFKEVEVVARISKNGIANRGPGDVEGKTGPVVVTAGKPLSIMIDQVLP